MLVPSVVSEADSEATGPGTGYPRPRGGRTPRRPESNQQRRSRLTTSPRPQPSRCRATPPRNPGPPRPVHLAPRLSYAFSGSPALLYPDGTPVDSLREAALELLVYLAVHRERRRSRRHQGSALPGRHASTAPPNASPPTSPTSATASGTSSGLAGDRADPVINTGGRYHLNSDLVDVDWWTVHDLATSAKHSEDRDERMRFLREAIDAYHGRPRRRAPYEWLSSHQERSRRLGVALHVALAKELADTDPAEAAQHWDAASSLDPHHEDLAVAAIRAHARNHDPDAIRATMRRLRRALDEIDEQPDESTRG